jgi:hypothetical protein
MLPGALQNHHLTGAAAWVLTIAVAAGGAGELRLWRLAVVVLHALKLLFC